jgi:monoamine oxidase
MTRKDFIKMCAILGISVPIEFGLKSCGVDVVKSFFGKVVIIGAGAGGLSAAYLLRQKGIESTILEASASYGGRMKIDNDFADFPIPLGAEWLETKTSVFAEILNDSNISVDIETVSDDPDRKFVNYSWYNFYEEYIVPSVSDNIVFNSVVNSIDYVNDKILVKTNTEEYSADKVILSVPLKILQKGDIKFTPPLPSEKQEAINEPLIWDGFKAFFEFTDKFYKDEHDFNITPTSDGQKIYYNAAFGQNTTKHIVGLFTVGKPARDYIDKSGDDLKDFILDELDAIYSNQATPKYVKHIIQNWNDTPYIEGGYMSDEADWKTVQKLGTSVDNKLYFAGGAYTDGQDWVSVHTAAQSAKVATDALIK